MKQQVPQEEWLRVLGKGMVTIPKAWRDELGIDEGKLIKAKRVGGKIIFDPLEEEAPYRIFSAREIKQWLKDDKMSPKLAKRIKRLTKDIP